MTRSQYHVASTLKSLCKNWMWCLGWRALPPFVHYEGLHWRSHHPIVHSQEPLTPHAICMVPPFLNFHFHFSYLTVDFSPLDTSALCPIFMFSWAPLVPLCPQSLLVAASRRSRDANEPLSLTSHLLQRQALASACERRATSRACGARATL